MSKLNFEPSKIRAGRKIASVTGIVSPILGSPEGVDVTNSNTRFQDYRILNDNGKGEARKRVNELTEIPKYKKGSVFPLVHSGLRNSN